MPRRVLGNRPVVRSGSWVGLGIPIAHSMVDFPETPPLQGTHSHLVLSDAELGEVDGADLELRCSQVVFDCREYGSSGLRHVTAYGDGGRVVFHSSGTEPAPRATDGLAVLLWRWQAPARQQARMAVIRDAAAGEGSRSD